MTGTHPHTGTLRGIAQLIASTTLAIFALIVLAISNTGTAGPFANHPDAAILIAEAFALASLLLAATGLAAALNTTRPPKPTGRDLPPS